MNLPDRQLESLQSLEWSSGGRHLVGQRQSFRLGRSQRAQKLQTASLHLRASERAITAFAQGSNGGLIVTGSTGAGFHRGLIVALAARHRLPAVYFARYFATGRGLISYGPDFVDQFRRAAGYVDRILKGEKPADLPVQAPTKYELVTTSRPPMHSASPCRQPCSPGPMR